MEEENNEELAYRVKQLESEGVLIGEGFGICLKYVQK